MAKSGNSSGKKRDAAPTRPTKGKLTRGAQLAASKGGKPGVKGAKPGAKGGKPGTPAKGRAPKRPAATPVAPESETIAPAAVFRLGMVPGATPGKWIDAWHERMPVTAIELEPIELRDQHDRLRDGGIDAALVRLPLTMDGLSVIPLYDEVAVVMMNADSSLTVAEELDLADLAGEIVIAPLDDVYGLEVAGAVAPAFEPPADTAEAVATVAAGVGVLIVPLSLARLHRRKDAPHRRLRDGPTSTVALAWPTDRTTPEVEAFIGIVRGRTANSSRA